MIARVVPLLHDDEDVRESDRALLALEDEGDPVPPGSSSFENLHGHPQGTSAHHPGRGQLHPHVSGHVENSNDDGLAETVGHSSREDHLSTRPHLQLFFSGPKVRLEG